MGQPLTIAFAPLVTGVDLEPVDPRRFPPKDFSTAASKTRRAAAQMSGPMPSPSMNGTIGSSGTLS
jgi:hypothetical protein